MILGVDYGTRRVGVAAADLETRVARPIEVIDTEARDPIARIVELVAERKATEVVVGRPVGLSGRSGPSAQAAEGFTQRLRETLEVPVRGYDERLSTVVAEQGLRSAGVKARERKGLRDAVAAQVILQGYVDSRP